MPSSSGSIVSGGTTEPVMMISPARSRSPNAASTSATWRTMSTHCAGVGLRIGGARELVAAPDDAAGQTIGAAPARAGAGAAEHHMALIDVVAEDALGVLGRLV